MTLIAPLEPSRPVRADPAVTLVLVLGLFALVGAELAAILALNRGVLLYSTDDSFIHLSLATHLREGHYGINAGEVSSPSSSVLWPFLLAPFGAWARFEWMPFLLNLLAATGTAFAVAHLLARVLGQPTGRGATAFHAAVGVLLLVLFNVVGLVFVGMEHSLQLFLTLLAVLGLHDVSRRERPPDWLWPVLVAGPLVRYENLAVTLPALAFLLVAGHRRAAIATAAVLIALLGAFSLFLVAHGLPPLPSSTLAKQGMVAGGDTPFAFHERLARSLLGTWSGPWLVLLAGALLARAARGGERLARAFSAVFPIAIVGHAMFGGFGWFHRYELYLVAAAVSAAALEHAHRLRDGLRRLPRLAGALVLAGLALASGKSLYMLLMTPLAAHEIYRQQYVMGRIAREVLRGPVAVNDLGLVAFRNPYHVVDLWGLGSPGALAARQRSRDMAWADSLCRRHGVVAAMIYRPWFPGTPAGWRHVGELRLGPLSTRPGSGVLAGLARFAHRERGTVVVAGESVSVFAVRPGDEERLRASLERFRPSLVPGAELVVR